MPQLDLLSFSSQIFWLTIIFFLIYIFSIKFILPTFILIKRLRIKRAYKASLMPFVKRFTKPSKSLTRILYRFRVLRYFKRIVYRKKIYAGAMRNLQRGLSFRFRYQVFRKKWARNLRKSMIKISPFSSILFVNDTMILFISFSIFFLSLYVYFSNFNFTAYNEKKEELRKLFNVSKQARKDELYRRIERLNKLKNYRQHIISSFSAFTTLIGSTIPTYTSTYSYILISTLKAQQTKKRNIDLDRLIVKHLFPKIKDAVKKKRVIKFQRSDLRFVKETRDRLLDAAKKIKKLKNL